MAPLFVDCTYHDIYAPIKSQTITFFKLIVKFEIDCETRDRENRNLEFTHVYLFQLLQGKYFATYFTSTNKKMDTKNEPKNNFDK